MSFALVFLLVIFLYNDAPLLKSCTRAYIKAIMVMVFAKNHRLDQKALVELLLLMTRLNLSQHSRFMVREYMMQLSENHRVCVEDLLATIKEHACGSLHRYIMVSLVKDFCNIALSIGDDADLPSLEEYKELFELREKDRDFIKISLEDKSQLLKDEVDDDVLSHYFHQLKTAARIASIPLGVVYLSGSVIGLSASGITSGLATLGVFGSGMSGGIVAVGLMSIALYEGFNKWTGANEVDRYRIKEQMLLEVVKQTQKILSLIIEDSNYFIAQLNELLKSQRVEIEQVKKLVRIITELQATMKTLDARSDLYHNAVYRIHCPKELDQRRLEYLTSDTTKQSLYHFLIEQYQPFGAKLWLKDRIDTDTLEKMSKAFKSIGYFNVGNIVQNEVTSLVGSLMNKFKG